MLAVANLEEVFDNIQKDSKQIEGYLVHFYKFIVRLIIRGCIVVSKRYIWQISHYQK